MKTPLQQLRENLKEHQKGITIKNTYNNGYKCALVDVMELIDGIFILKEKQALKDAYNQGYREGNVDTESKVYPEKDISEFDILL
jgi:hypothetical protein